MRPTGGFNVNQAGAQPAVMPKGFGQPSSMPAGPNQGQMQQMQGLRSTLDARKNAYIQQNGTPSDAASQQKMRSYMEGLPEMNQMRSLQGQISQGGMGAQPGVMPPPQGQYSPMQPTSDFNVNQAAAGSLQQAIGTAGGLANFQAQRMRAAGAGPTATYGGATVERTPAYGGATVAPATTYGGATIERTQGPQAAQLGAVERYAGASINPIERAQAAQLGDAERMQGVGAVRSAMAPDQIAVDQIRTADISQYMNPYQQQVIQAGQADIERQRQMASENLAAQAQRAGAFGGSRQAVQEGVLAGEALRQAGALSAQQRQSGFQQAVESGKFDIGQTQQARTLESQQGFQAEQLGQQAREAAAAREQAARAGNMQAANRFAEQQAQLEQQSTLANQSAFNTRAQAQAGLQQQAGLASMQAANQFTTQQAQMEQQAGLASAAQEAARASQQAGLLQSAGLAGAAAQNAVAAQQAGLTQAAGLTAAQQDAARASQQAGLTQSAGLSNQAAINQAVQAQAARQQAANQANFGGQFQAAGVRAGAAGQLGQLGQQAFNTSQSIQQQQSQQGLLQQGLQQQLINAARGQYAGAIGAPQQSLGLPLAALGAAPAPQSTTQSMNPGLFNYMQLFAGMCWVAREVYGEDDPKWLQFREWVIGYSPDWFYKAYSKYGEKVAKVVAKVPALKLVIRPFMDAKRKALGYK